MKLKSEEVAQYLKQHPQFFAEYSDMLSNIYIPHPHSDRAIPISERQTIALRDKNKALQDKFLELVKFGKENDIISEKMHDLAIMFLTFTDLKDFLNEFHLILRDIFSISHAEIRLWNINSENPEISKFISSHTEIHTITNDLLSPYCGPELPNVIKCLFGENIDHLHSFSMIPLKAKQITGLLVLASADHQRFYPKMGTLYLQRIGELVSTFISQYSKKYDK
ncbi:MAG: hypothetical protein CMH70_07110 [Nitrosomonadaceae bacterium]|nr:hypothetical protein [Nitrosomonadaceae bacterium]